MKEDQKHVNPGLLALADGVVRLLNRLLTLTAVLLILLIFSYASFSLWNNYVVSHYAFGSDLQKYKPSAENKEDLDSLMAKNPDVKGWLTIDNTHIDYPLVQGNYDYEYLNKDPLGEYTLSGSIFMSTTNAPDLSDPYTLIYGHHLSNGAMFGDVDLFMDQEFFDKNRTGSLITKDAVYRIDIFACVSCDAYDLAVYSEASQKTGDLPGLAAEFYKKAVTQREMEIANGDHIVALSTCAEATTNGRYVLFGKLARES